MYPDVDVASEIIDFVRTDWGNDPLAQGSYSFNGLGSRPGRDFVNLRGEELFNGRMLFAGEHTHCRYFGTVHGAYMSGNDGELEWKYRSTGSSWPPRAPPCDHTLLHGFTPCPSPHYLSTTAADCIIKGSCPKSCYDADAETFLTNKAIVGETGQALGQAPPSTPPNTALHRPSITSRLVASGAVTSNGPRYHYLPASKFLHCITPPPLLPHHLAITLGGVAAMLLICLVGSWVRDGRPRYLWELYGPGSRRADRVSLRTPGAAGSSGPAFAEGTPSSSVPHFGTERERTLSGAEENAGELDAFESGEVFNTITGLQQPEQVRATSSNLEMARYPSPA